MSKPIAQHVYDFYGRFYDHVFEGIFRKRVARAIRVTPMRPGDRVLDVGIGTGLSLEFYPDDVQVYGLDLSAGMLAQAKKKNNGGQTGARASLVQSDALRLPFADGSFDCVFMSHVIATVPDPYLTMREALRVARDHAWITLVNHFQSPWPVISWVETAIDPLCRRLGWRTDLSLRGLLHPLAVQDLRNARGAVFQTVWLEKRGQTVRMVDLREGREGEAKPVLGSSN